MATIDETRSLCLRFVLLTFFVCCIAQQFWCVKLVLEFCLSAFLSPLHGQSLLLSVWFSSSLLMPSRMLLLMQSAMIVSQNWHTQCTVTILGHIFSISVTNANCRLHHMIASRFIDWVIRPIRSQRWKSATDWSISTGLIPDSTVQTVMMTGQKKSKSLGKASKKRLLCFYSTESYAMWVREL